MKAKAVALFTAALLFLGGCQGVANSSGYATKSGISGKEDSNVLTDRQRALLSEIGIMEDESGLTERKINAVKAIDAMLDYLKKTYGKTFVYAGYTEAAGITEESLLAYIEGESPSNLVTVKRKYADGKYEYSDDYANLAARLAYADALKDYAGKMLTVEKVFVDVKNVPDGELPDGEKIFGVVSASAVLLLDDDKVSPADTDSFLEAFEKTLGEAGGFSPLALDIYLMDTADLVAIGEENYHDMLLRTPATYAAGITRDAEGILKRKTYETGAMPGG